MDETEKGSEVTPAEEKTAQQPAVEAKPPEPPKADPGPKKQHNWTQIALIALSVVVVLLLASTITLAVTGNFGHGGRGFGNGYQMQQGNRGPMMRGFRRGTQDGDTPPWMNRDQQNQQRQQNNQAPQSTPSVPTPQQAPAPTQ